MGFFSDIKDFAGGLVGAAAPILGAIAGGPIGAGIGAGIGSLGSSLTQSQAISDANAGSMALAQYQNAFNMQMYEKQKQDSIEFWNMQNEYNSPKATMQRLVDAGLNPRGSGLGQYANAGSLNSPSAQPAAGAQYRSPLAAYSELGSTLGGILQIKANIEKTEAETKALNEKSNADAVRSWAQTFKMMESMDKHAYWKFLNGVEVLGSQSTNFDSRLYNFSDDGLGFLDRKIKRGILNEYNIKNSILEESHNLGIGNGDGGWLDMLTRMLIRNAYRGINPDKTMFNR